MEPINRTSEAEREHVQETAAERRYDVTPAPSDGVTARGGDRRDWALIAGLGLLAVFAWPQWALVPQPGLDPGWITGLQLAEADKLVWGKDVLYTYGPLGFISVPQVWNWTSLLGGLLYGAAAVLAVTAVPFLILRTQMALAGAVVVTSAIALVAPTGFFLPETLSLGAFVLAVAVFQGVEIIRPTVLAGVLGGLAGVQLLVKPPTSVVALLAGLLVVLCPSPGVPRRFLVGVGSFVGVVVVAWLVTSQSLLDLPHWFSGVVDIASYYSEATFSAPPEKFFEFVGALAMVVGLVLYVRSDAARMARRRSVLLIGVCTFVLWLTSKEAFVRHDIHSTIFFFTVAFLPIAIRTARPVRLANLGILVGSGLLLASLASGSTLDETLDPTASVRSFLSVVTYIVAPGNRAVTTENARGTLQASYAIPSDILDALEKGTVHVDPNETSLVWAYNLHWKPVPVFQRYAAFTSRSDGGNAQALSNRATAPDRILRQQASGFDGRNDLWDSPRYMVNLICDYRQSAVRLPWQLLTWAPSRCGAMRLGNPINFHAGQTIQVPHASDHELVVAWLTVHQSIWERIRTLLFRPSTHIIVTTGSSAFNIATPEVAGPLLMRIPNAVGWDPAFGGGVDYRSFSLNRDGAVKFGFVPLS